jgi:hypothetical protein
VPDIHTGVRQAPDIDEESGDLSGLHGHRTRDRLTVCGTRAATARLLPKNDIEQQKQT